MVVGGLIEVEVLKRLLCFGVDDVDIFQGAWHGITIQIQQCYVPFFIRILWMAHSINLGVQTFFHLPMVMWLENLLQSFNSLFCKSPKCHLEFVKIALIVEIKNN
jgi:hypothetical protein